MASSVLVTPSAAPLTLEKTIDLPLENYRVGGNEIVARVAMAWVLLPG